MINNNNENKIFKIFLILALILNNPIHNYFVINRKNNQIILANSTTLKIFIMAHKDFYNARYNPVYNIVVDDKSQLKNKYFLNIIYSNKGQLYKMSRAYGEMSKLYFIYQLYKNETIFSRYIGLNHYRRFFNFGDNIPNIDNIFKKYDVILDKQINLKKDNIMTQYCKNHICKIFVEILDIIKSIKPNYYKSALKTVKKRKMYIGNIFIMKKEDFFKYCEFIFDILFEFDKRNNLTSDIDVFNYTKKFYNNNEECFIQSRLQGYLAERISNIFFNYYFKKIKTISIDFII